MTMTMEKDPLIERKFELLLEMQAQKIGKELTELKQAMSQLNNEIARLKTRLNGIRQAAPAPAAPPQPQQSQPQQSQPTAAKSEEKKEPHPRHGNYNSDDVSIEKFFYTGKR